MSLLSEKDREHLKKELSVIKQKVKVLFFTQELECQFCRETEMILEELASLHDWIMLEKIPFLIEREKAEKYGVDKVPGIVIFPEGKEEIRVRFFGIPAGYEFISLLGAVIDAGRGYTELKPENIEKIKKIDLPVHIQVFVTPTCPYCPSAVRLAHQIAFENPNITGDMIEATEFIHLANRYHVMGVPKTIINEKIELEGSYPEDIVVTKVLEAAGIIKQEPKDTLNFLKK